MSQREPVATPGRARSSSPRSASSRPRSGGCSSTGPSSRASPRRRCEHGRARPHGRPRLLRQRRLVRRLRVRPRSPGLTAVRDSISLARLLRGRPRHERIDRRRALAVGPDAGRARVPRPRPAAAARSRSRSRTSRSRSSRRAAEAVLPLAAGPELAVAATKTYSNQLGALGLLAGARRRARATSSQARSRRPPTCSSAACPRSSGATSTIAVPFVSVGRMFVIGRGPEFATAREIALKLLETCHIAAEPLTATDLAHGPVAALDPLFPVWAVAAPDATLDAVVDATARARGRRARPSSPAGRPRRRSRTPSTSSPSRRRATRCSTPLLSVVPGQLFAGAVARAQGPRPGPPARPEQGHPRPMS